MMQFPGRSIHKGDHEGIVAKSSNCKLGSENVYLEIQEASAHAKFNKQQAPTTHQPGHPLRPGHLLQFLTQLKLPRGVQLKSISPTLPHQAQLSLPAG